MGLGYQGRLYILAFDHRASFSRGMFGIEGEPTAEQTKQIADAKLLIYEGLVAATESGEVAAGDVGVLVDEQFGGEVPRLARERGMVLAMSVEKSGQKLFDFEYGDGFGEHIDRFDPYFSKVLVRYNPEDDAGGNRVQLGRLKRLADWLHERDHRFLFEMLVPATDDQLGRVDGDERRYEAELRPGLIARGIAEAQEFGVEVDVWKLEGVDSTADAEALVRQARSGDGREGVVCVLLGAGADDHRVESWLGVVGATEGFSGFAIGRSIWREPLRASLAGEIDRDEAANRIAQDYLRFVRVYERAAS
jgi:5-dehydro-2-deoxygluconokinase